MIFCTSTVRSLTQPFLKAYRDHRDAEDDASLPDATLIPLAIPVGAIRKLWDALGVSPYEIEP